MKFQRINIIIVGGFLLFFMGSVYAQDIHFSQIGATPLIINPANAGVMDNEFRFANNYRNQWQKIQIPYKTVNISLDKRIFAFGQALGAGANFIHDMSGSNYFTVDKVYFALSYSRFIKSHQVAIGLQPGLIYKSYNARNMTFDAQFDPFTGTFDPSLPANENELSDNLSYFDLNAGVMWRSRIRKWSPQAGFTMDHINRPVESFVLSGNERALPFRYKMYGSIYIPLINKFDITPLVYHSFTGKSREFIGGNVVGYNMDNIVAMVQRIYGISMLRVDPVRNFDALILGTGVQFRHVDIAVSYDFNVSSLRKASNFNGAFEVSLILTGSRRPSSLMNEPCFML